MIVPSQLTVIPELTKFNLSMQSSLCSYNDMTCVSVGFPCSLYPSRMTTFLNIGMTQLAAGHCHHTKGSRYSSDKRNTLAASLALLLQLRE